MTSSSKQIVDHFFRHEYGRVVSFLTKKFGSEAFDLVEDAVQDALIKAMQVWPFKGQPDNPSAWVMRVAQNRLIDQFRRSKNLNEKLEKGQFDSHSFDSINEPSLSSEIEDDYLNMMFACCHPKISQENQIILVLKILVGFGTSEIARALLKSEAAVAKAYTRAKQKFKSINKSLEGPTGKEVESRLDNVLKIIYLIYNEGYNAVSEEKLIRHDICYEAMRLNKILIDHESLNTGNANALLALMCFQSARFESRVKEGRLLTLEEQDRSKWDLELIQQGAYFLQQSAASGKVGVYHLQASIAACHSLAASFEKTNWEQILELYNTLIAIKNDVIIQLNRIVALAKVRGASEAIAEIKRLPVNKLSQNYIYHAIYASLFQQTGDTKNALMHYKKALSLTMNQYEKRHLTSKIEAIS